jgi:hypothetical protein
MTDIALFEIRAEGKHAARNQSIITAKEALNFSALVIPLKSTTRQTPTTSNPR